MHFNLIFRLRFTCNFNLLLLKYLMYNVIKAGWSMTSPYNYLQTDYRKSTPLT